MLVSQQYTSPQLVPIVSNYHHSLNGFEQDLNHTVKFQLFTQHKPVANRLSTLNETNPPFFLVILTFRHIVN